MCAIHALHCVFAVSARVQDAAFIQVLQQMLSLPDLAFTEKENWLRFQRLLPLELGNIQARPGIKLSLYCISLAFYTQR